MSFWELGIMLGSGLGLYSIMIGQQVKAHVGPGPAISSILLGNFILWFVGLGIISMAGGRYHIVQVIKENFGKISAVVAAIIVVAAFLFWFALHIQAPSTALTNVINYLGADDKGLKLRMGTLLGVTCALLSIGGIKFIKWFNICVFPFLILSSFYILLNAEISNQQYNFFDFSFVGVTYVVLTWLPGTVNLSSFFRHSRSRANSFMGMTLMFAIHVIFQLSALFWPVENPIELVNWSISKSPLLLTVMTCFIVLSFYTVNLINIYWASIGWGYFFKHQYESKSYTIIGLLGTMIYLFLQSFSIIETVEGIGSASIACIGTVLIASYFMKLVIRHRPRLIDKLSNAFSWCTGFVAALISILFLKLDSTNSTLIGMNTTLVTFGIIIFFEEIIWSLKKMTKRKR